MQLLNPYPGEIWDRLTILDLKIRASDKLGRDATMFMAERDSLKDRIRYWEEDLTESKKYEIGIEVNGLVAVNSLMWDIEDKIRAIPEVGRASEQQIRELAILCKSSARLNDSRALLTRKISEHYGEEDEVPEKIFGVRLGV